MIDHSSVPFLLAKYKGVNVCCNCKAECSFSESTFLFCQEICLTLNFQICCEMAYSYLLKLCIIIIFLIMKSTFLRKKQHNCSFTHAPECDLKISSSSFSCVKAFIVFCRKQKGWREVAYSSIFKVNFRYFSICM